MVAVLMRLILPSCVLLLTTHAFDIVDKKDPAAREKGTAQSDRLMKLFTGAAHAMSGSHGTSKDELGGTVEAIASLFSPQREASTED